MSSSTTIQLSRRSENAIKHKAALMTAAYSLFTKKGFQATTMTDIAANAGLSKRTLFNYFPSKQRLFLAILEADNDASLDRMAARLNGSTLNPVAYLVDLIDGDIDYTNIFNDLDLWRELTAARMLVNREPESASLAREYRSSLFQHLQLGLTRLAENRRFHDGIPIDDLTTIIFSVAFFNYHQVLSGVFTNPALAREHLSNSLETLLSPYLQA